MNPNTASFFGAEPPGPRGWPLIGSLPAFSRDPIGFWMRLALRHGGVAKYRMGPERHFLISDPVLIGQVLHHDVVRYYRGKYHELLKPAFGEGLLTANGDEWRRQRQFLQPAFSKQRIASWLDIVVEGTEARMAAWSARPRSSPIGMAGEMAGLIQDINAKILFGRNLPYRANAAMLEAVNAINDSLLRQVKRAMIGDGWLNRLPLADVRRFRGAVSLLHQTVDHLIEHQRAQEENGGGLCALLTRAAIEASPEALHPRDQLITLFLSGHETTAVALAWIFYFLTEHPDWAERLSDEAVTVLADRPPAVEDLPRLSQTRRAVDESLRLRPPVYGIGRRARIEHTLGTWRIPAESPVLISPYVMHHHPDYWENPDRFDPDRFVPEQARSRPSFSYFPFGGGPHTCLGRHLAMMELLTIVALVARAFRLSAPKGRRVALQPWLTLRPKPEVLVSVARRMNISIKSSIHRQRPGHGAEIPHI
ncbi:MAG: cytochrome P450 [Candidatus Competibacteraceae bacterium]|nr:cytochrome P450 [Candidatus Competibacteraceae bacterium]